MEEMSTETVSRPFEGATSENIVETEETKVDPNNLPMIVWLRGDEPYVEDFSLDADAAMEQLGIKRSRLTQISGKELRVGRIRIDRYTRPVYRQADIDAYKSWSRAPATHQKSSSVISSAAEQLAEQGEKLAESLNATMAAYAEKIDKGLQSLREEHGQRLEKTLEATRSITESVKVRFLEVTNEHFKETESRFSEMSCSFESAARKLEALDTLSEKVDHHTQQVQTQRDDLGQITASLAALEAKIDQQATALEDYKTTQSQFNRDIGKALSIIIQFQRETSKKQDQTNELIKEQGESADAEETQTAKPVPRRRRRAPVTPRRRARCVL